MAPRLEHWSADLSSRVLATFQAAMMACPFSQGVGLRPRPWAGISRPVGPVGRSLAEG